MLLRFKPKYLKIQNSKYYLKKTISEKKKKNNNNKLWIISTIIFYHTQYELNLNQTTCNNYNILCFIKIIMINFKFFENLKNK